MSVVFSWWSRRRSVQVSLIVLLAIVLALLLVQPHPPPSIASPVEEAMAEADRLDPGWRLEQMQAQRRPLPDADNSAVCVQEACSRLPPDWPEEPLDSLLQTPPQMLLSQADSEHLAAELAPAAPALEEARRLSRLRRGYFPLAQTADAPSAKPFQDARQCARLLEWQAWQQAQEDDAEGAIRSLVAMIHTGAAIDDEPWPVAQLIRLDVQQATCRTLERVLAQTKPTANTLARLQAELQREQEHRALLWMLRGERIELLKRRPDPVLLHRSTQAVQNARLQVSAQAPGLSWLDLPEPPFSYRPSRFLRPWYTSQAYLGCAITALACERYRIGRQRWPTRLAELTPDLLPAVPMDPFTGEPLRYAVLADGLWIHAVGTRSQGKEIGVRLWSPKQRRQKPGAGKGEDLFGQGRTIRATSVRGRTSPMMALRSAPCLRAVSTSTSARSAATLMSRPPEVWAS